MFALNCLGLYLTVGFLSVSDTLSYLWTDTSWNAVSTLGGKYDAVFSCPGDQCT